MRISTWPIVRSDDGLDARMTGTFNGPLQRVAARILEGYDFAMKITPQGIDVLVLRQGQAGGKAIAASTLASLKSPAKPMTAAEANRGLALIRVHGVRLPRISCANSAR